MQNLTALHRAFNQMGMTLEADNEDAKEHVMTIYDSMRLPSRVAAEIAARALHCPIISSNRIDGHVQFTVVPYLQPARFEKCILKFFDGEEAELWRRLESTPTPFDPNAWMCLPGLPRPYTAGTLRREIMIGCSKISSLVVEFLDEPRPAGRALDLGSGQGANAIPLLERNWRVTVVDREPETLKLFRKYQESERLTLIEGDITKLSWSPNSFELILCIDVLPYIEPKKIKALVQKIYDAITPDGCFIGTAAFHAPNALQNQKDLEDYFGKIGLHCYPEEELFPTLLERVGFHVHEYGRRWDAKLDRLGLQPMWAQFRARKRITSVS